ncbi:MAG: polyprenyl synthetase family protein [Phycisphaerae bacterium]|nr:polyprenyl synthetase family protein [Phycisphaerae bacterium]
MPDDRAIAAKPSRPPQDNVPQSKQARELLLEVIRAYVERQRPVPPLTIEELRTHTTAVLDEAGVDRKYFDFAGVLVNNEVWRETVAAIPYEKRLLLLPKCLRSVKECPAKFDEIGLLCEHCGRCVIDDLKSQAERLGYAVLVAEGSPVVMSLIESGRIEGVVGASCLSVLEKVFPYMEAGAVPGIAIPLLRDGCANTSVDLDWLWEAVYQTAEDQTRRFNLDVLHGRVDHWFSRESLEGLLTGRVCTAHPTNATEQVALEWMAKAGKRWRPFLAACSYEAFCADGYGRASVPARLKTPCGDARPTDEDDLRKVAVAVECFHKASLIHDDIEDGDSARYGEKTLHAEHGIPIALNVGDFLLGEGYRLLADVDAPDARKVKLLSVAAQGHRSLCLGQGSELAWMRTPVPLTVRDVLDIFRMKTAPAFEVALSLGAILAGCDERVHEVLRQYSESLGIAYQIRDDLDDLRSPHKEDLFNGKRPSILLALAYENAGRVGCAHRSPLVDGQDGGHSPPYEFPSSALRTEIEASAWRLMETYKSQAIGSLIALKNANLKGLLRRVIGKMFNDFDSMGCCNDPGAEHAPDRG